MPFLARSRFLYLKSIELAGFKSFARPTRLELPPGITALVGPNGSGKSNIVDAIRWCLGDQNPRDLRAQRADEVIHAGPRRVLGLAEVSLALECEEGDSSGPVTLGRRLFRSGESEYLVNGDRVRLRDLVAALREIGIDGSRYIVVNQGMADAFLAATPLERRALLEHAAGLSGYRAQRDEASNKLATTGQNVHTIEMVLAEMEPRLRTLRRQARAVQDREETAARLRTVSLAWYAARWQAASEELQQLIAALDAATDERQQAEVALRTAEEATVVELQAERAHRARLETARAAMHATQRESDAARFNCRQLEERRAALEKALEEAGARLSHIGVELNKNRDRLTAAEAECNRLALEEETLKAQSQSSGGARARLETEIREMEAAEQSTRRALDEANLRREGLERERAVAEEALAARRDDARDLNTRVQANIETLVSIDRQIEAHAPETTKALESLEQCRAALAELEERMTVHRQRQRRLRKVQASVQAQLARLERRTTAIQSSLAAAGPSDMQRRLTNIDVPPGWERAVAAALGPSDGVDSDHAPSSWTTAELSEFLQWRSALSDWIAPAGQWADDLLHAHEAGALDPLLGTVFVAGERAADELWAHLAPRQAHRIGSPPIQVVNKRGIARRALGTSSAGDDRALRYLELRSEDEAIARRLDTRRRLDAGLAASEAEQANTLLALEQELAVAASRAAEAEAAEDVAARHGATLERERWQIEAEASASRQGLESALAQIAALEQRLSDLEPELAGAVREAEERDQALRPVVVSLAERREELSRAATDAATRRGQAEVAGARRAHQSEVLEATRRETARLRSEQEDLLQHAARLAADEARLAGEASTARLQLDDLAAVLREQQAHLEKLEAESKAEQAGAPDLAEPRRRLADAMRGHERAAARAEQHRHAIAELREEIMRELGIQPEALPPAEAEPPQWEEVRRLRARAAQYAGADDSSLRELQELEERYSGLTRHLEDIKTASHDLRQIMTTADHEMQRRFATAMAAVDEEFSRVFQIMLGGGQARLEEVDDDGGIGVRAQLPGRRARSSNAFSGGERTLVASSLLFGVLRIRPTPFCVLDEVDAALDESNVDRYLAALREIGRRTQVIVVTHNRATMAAADALYGVTMEEEGVSSLLSLRLEEYEAAGQRQFPPATR